MNKTVWSWVLRAPVYLLMLVGFVFSIVASVRGDVIVRGNPIGWGTVVLFGLIIVSYIIGLKMLMKKR